MPPKGLIVDKLVMDSPSIDRAIVRMAHEILERNKETENLVLIGIQTRGIILAQRLRKAVEDIAKVKLPFGILDINLYRDDLTTASAQPVIRKTEINFAIDNKTVILVDDVLYTGRTIRSALDALIDFGRPKFIKLAALIDRGWRELPIQADYTGKFVKDRKSVV